MNVSIKDLEKLIFQSIQSNYSARDARKICDVVLFGELSGKTTHGIVRLFADGNESIFAQVQKEKPVITKITPVSSLIDSKGNPGPLVGSIAMQESIRLARKNGVGVVGTNRSFTSSGCLSYYAEKIARENFIAIIMAQSPAATTPYGSIEPLFGTNPIAFGIPAHPRPLIFDMATSAITFGAMLKAARLNQRIPEGVAIDKTGRPTTDPKKAMEGATLPFDSSHKGTGLTMMIEILAGIMPGADFAGQNPSGGWGNLFITLSPTLLGDLELFKKNVKKLVERVRNSKTKTGNKIRIVGEHTLQTRDVNLKKGEVEIDDKLYDELKKSASQIN